MAIDHGDHGKGMWGFPSWISNAFFASTSQSTTTKSQKHEMEQRANASLRRRLSPSATEGSNAFHNKELHIPGYMDFDPKMAAKNAHRSKPSSSQHSALRGEGSWFHL